MRIKASFKAIAIAFVTTVCCQTASAQSDSVKSEVRLSKNDRIRLAAFDDTTKVLANLFIAERIKISKNNKTCLLVAGASVGAYFLGGLMLQKGLNRPAGAYNIINYTGLYVMLVGAVGVASSVGALGINAISLSPYTVRKYNRLIAMHKSGKPLPEFYILKIAPIPSE